MTKDEALKMAYDWVNEYAPPEVVQACKEALEQPNRFEGYTTIEIGHKKPAQEPVAWIKKTWCPELDWYDDFKSGAFADETDKEGWTPLYTHPAPPWHELSDAEVEALADFWNISDIEIKEFIKKVERMSKEINT